MSIKQILKEELNLLTEAKKEKSKKVQAAGVLLFHPDGKKILLARRSHGDAIGQFSIFGGCVEEGESKVDAIVRELKEESGIEGLDKAKFKRALINKVSPLLTYWNYTYQLEEVPKISLNKEHDWYKFYDVKDLPNKTHEGVIKLLKHLKLI